MNPTHWLISTQALALFDAARQLGVRHPLVVAFDGGGNDGHTLAFAGNATAEPPLARLSLRDDALGVDFAEVNFANRYAGVAAALPEVARGQCAPAAARTGPARPPGCLLYTSPSPRDS